MAYLFEVRRDTAANWTTANPVLFAGQEAVETDTLRRKIGDGVTAWSSLPYATHPPADLDSDLSAVVTPGGSKTAAAIAADPALRAAYGASPEQWDRFDLKANGAPGNSGRNTAWSLSGGSVGDTAKPTVLGGKLTTPAAVTGAVGSYAVLPLAHSLTRLYARFTLSSYTTGNGSAGIIAWAQDITGTYPTIPDSPCHLAIQPTGWVFGVWSGGSFTQVANGSFATPLTADGVSQHACTVLINKANATAFLLLPDKTVARVSHTLIGSVSATFACWEVYRQASTDTTAAFAEVAADSTMPLAELPTVRALSVMPAAPIAVDYAPTAADIAVPTSLTLMDGTHLAVSFAMPPNCTAALVEFDGFVVHTSGGIYWAVYNGATAYGTKTMLTTAYSGSLHYSHKLTGLAPGASYTLQMAHLSGSAGNTLKLDDPNGYSAQMRVTPLPA